MPVKPKKQQKKVIACTCRVDNYNWIKERRLFGRSKPTEQNAL